MGVKQNRSKRYKRICGRTIGGGDMTRDFCLNLITFIEDEEKASTEYEELIQHAPRAAKEVLAHISRQEGRHSKILNNLWDRYCEEEYRWE